MRGVAGQHRTAARLRHVADEQAGPAAGAARRLREALNVGDELRMAPRPIDEQFLVSLRKIDWGTAPNVLMGGILMVIALWEKGWVFDPLRMATFCVVFVCATAIAYGFMLLLTSLSVWMVRNQSLMEMWWLFSSLATIPRSISPVNGRSRWATSSPTSCRFWLSPTFPPT